MTTPFDRFYQSEYASQFRRAALILRSAELASDVVQDAFVTVWERWDTIGEPGPYLNRCVLNGCRGSFRRQEAQTRTTTKLAAERSEPPGDEPLWDALGMLPFDLRAPLVLRFYGGLTNGEIADALGWPLGSVGPRITKGLRTLERSLG